MSSEPAATDDGSFGDRTTSARRAVDWIIAAVLILIGLVATTAGGLIVGLADRQWFIDLIEDETIDSDVITEAELVDLLYAGTWWGGTGVVVAGIAMLLAGVLFGIGRRKVDALEPGAETPTLVANALLGAFVTALTSFVPFSGLLGGGVAGYLETDDGWSGALVGMLSGALLAAPLAIVALLVMVGLAAEGLAIWALVLLLVLLFGFGFSIVIAGLGGALGAYLRSRN